MQPAPRRWRLSDAEPLAGLHPVVGQVLAARALFVFIGMAPCTSWLRDMVDVDDYGFIRTGNDAFSGGDGPILFDESRRHHGAAIDDGGCCRGEPQRVH